MKLAQSCKDSIRRLGLGHCVKLTDKSIAEIGSICKKLEALDISVCSKITDESINEVAKGCHGMPHTSIINITTQHHLIPLLRDAMVCHIHTSSTSQHHLTPLLDAM
eukprot:1189796-Amorphochlora_amoeboformis.AAC.1